MVALVLLVTGTAVDAATFAPDRTTDANDATPGDGLCVAVGGGCTLRAAITEANAASGADEIVLLADTYALEPLLGALDIDDDLEIRGASWQTTAVETAHLSVQPLLRIASGASVTLRKLAIIAQTRGDGGIENDGDLTVTESYVAGQNSRGVPGILNREVLMVADSTIEGHFGDFGGTAAIANLGSVTVLRSAILGSAGREGGVILATIGDAFVGHSVVAAAGNGTGIANSGTLEAVGTEISGGAQDFGCPRILGGGVANYGSMELTECSVAGWALCGGGALANFGIAEVTASTLGGDSDHSGGAIANDGTLVMRNSTVSSSSTNGEVGAIDNLDGGTIELHGCTVSDNTGGQFATVAGGVRGTHIAIGHTIIAGNHGTPPDCQGTLLSLGHNLIGDTTGCTIIGDVTTNVLNVDPRLGPLAANGGSTFTHALLPESPARDAGRARSGAFCPATDQRGTPRPQGAACDIGAVEVTACGDGTVGPGEQCDDGNPRDGDCCSASCQLESDGSACSDGNSCTIGETCRAGACTSSTPLTCGPCATCNAQLGCVAEVWTACRQPTERLSGRLELANARSDKITWKWNDGEATSRADFGDPLGGETFAFCVFDESDTVPRVLLAAETRTGRCGKRPCWRSGSASTYEYKDPEAITDGIDTVFLKSAKQGAARVAVDIHGKNLVLPAMPLALPLRVQLQARSGACWEASYVDSSTSRNTTKQLRAKAFLP